MSDPATQTRTYSGRNVAEARAGAELDEASMAAAGYELSSQSWDEAIQYGVTSKILFAIAALLTAGGWLVTGWLSIVALVFLVAGLLARTRTGELTATWKRLGPVGQEPAPGGTSAAAQASSGTSDTA
jgi:hypothetical protein